MNNIQINYVIRLIIYTVTFIYLLLFGISIKHNLSLNSNISEHKQRNDNLRYLWIIT